MYTWNMATKTVAQQTQYSVTDARAALPDILDQVEAGATIQITRRGKPIAQVTSLDQQNGAQGQKQQTYAESYAEWRRKWQVDETEDEIDFTALLASIRAESSGRAVDFSSTEDWPE